ncbi:zinc finger protein 568 [Microplitis mediator]|uniref:zinc finger protein 568 n=1 Tax=Microplitis mediator TaxID=375433 RepID=UPI00255426A8|nr:zinc finger protein 568 [Microplitis mediator]
MSGKMCAQLFSCPLCARPSFSSLDSLRVGLVSVATRPLQCPVCNETLLGIDKLTIHLFGHTIINAPDDTKKLLIDNKTKVSENISDANINLHYENELENYQSDCAVELEQVKKNYLVKALNSCVIQSKEVANATVSINSLDQCESRQLPSVWTNDLLLHDLQNSTSDTKSSGVKIFKNFVPIKTAEVKILNADVDKIGSQLTLRIPESSDTSVMINNNDSNDNDNNCNYNCNSSNNNVNILPQLKTLKNNLMGKEKTERCNICGFHFPDHNILMLHKQIVHMIDEKDIDIKPEALLKNYPCHLCHKIFKMRGSLMVHMRVAHTGINLGSLTKDKDLNQVCCENGFNCPTCGKNFRKEQHVTQHLKTHEAKQWECDICSKMFTTKYFLKKHKRLHSGEMPYKCNICSKTFTFQQSYHKHRLYHKDDKPHTCTTCGRSFKELSTLHNHERIHTGEKPFACETCGKCFRQRVSYLVHRRIHTGVMPYTCTACGKSFRYKVSQRTHKCPVQTEARESLSDQSENSSGAANEVCNLPDTDKKTIEMPLEINEANKFVLVVNNGQPILKREQEVKFDSLVNSPLVQECDLINESVEINTDNFYPFVGIAAELRADLSLPSTEMKQLRLSSPTNEEIYRKSIDESFRETPDLHKDIKHAIDGILQERREINALETINDESFKQLLYEIDKKV